MGYTKREKASGKHTWKNLGIYWAVLWLFFCCLLTGCQNHAASVTTEEQTSEAEASLETEAVSVEEPTEEMTTGEETTVPETEAQLTVKELLRMNVISSEPRDGWILSFDELNVRRFCYSDSTVIGTFQAGQKVTVMGPLRYGFYPVSGTDAETGNEIYGYCHADYVSFMEYTGHAVSLDIVKYKQTDKRWSDIKLGTKKDIGAIGCTTTCFAMCEAYFTDTEITPADMSEMLTYTNGGDLYWPEDYKVSYNGGYLSKIYLKLHQGIPVLIGSRRSDGSQHWVLVTGYDPGNKEITKSSQLKAADFTINDPGAGRSTLGEFFRDLPRFNKFVYYIGHEQQEPMTQ